MVVAYGTSTSILLLLLLSDRSNTAVWGLQYGYDASDIQIHSIMIHLLQSGGAGA